MLGKVEDRHNALPDRLPAVHLRYGHRLDIGGFAAVRALNGKLEFGRGDLDHLSQV
jgi:hypothetical protein